MSFEKNNLKFIVLIKTGVDMRYKFFGAFIV